MNIVLVGLMGSGKSTVGRILADTLGRPFIDTDSLVEEAVGTTIADFFAREGEGAFRAQEAAVIARVARGEHQVIATGGGAVLLEANREALRATGCVIWLDAPVEDLLHRAKAQGIEKRPLLTGSDPLGHLAELARTRAAAYELAAHHRIETASGSPQTVACTIMVILKETR